MTIQQNITAAVADYMHFCHVVMHRKVFILGNVNYGKTRAHTCTQVLQRLRI